MKKILLLLFSIFSIGIQGIYAFKFNCDMSLGGGYICNIESAFCGCTGNPNGHDWLSIRGSLLTVGINVSNLEHSRPKMLEFFKNKSEYTFSKEFRFSAEIARSLNVKEIFIPRGTRGKIRLANGVYEITIPLAISAIPAGTINNKKEAVGTNNK